MDIDENDLSKDGENSLSQSLFDDQTSSRTRKDCSRKENEVISDFQFQP